MSNEPNEHAATSPFLPLVLMGLAVLLGLFSQLTSISRERAVLQRTADAQDQELEQIRQGKANLEKIALGLFELAKTDANAKAIVRKHGISMDPNAQPQPR